MIAHYWFFEDVGPVIDLYPLCSMLCAVCLAFEVDHPLGGQSVVWNQRGYYCLLFFTPLIFLLQKIAAMNWSEPKSYKPFELLCSQDFGFRGQWSRYRNSFCQSRVAYNDSLTIQPPIQCTDHDSCGVFWAYQPCFCACRWVLPLHHHPLWHVTKRLGNKVNV